MRFKGNGRGEQMITETRGRKSFERERQRERGEGTERERERDGGMTAGVQGAAGGEVGEDRERAVRELSATLPP